MKSKYDNYFKQLLAIAHKDRWENYKSLSTENLNYHWLLNNSSFYESELSIPVDSLDDASEIVSEFSKVPLVLVRESLSLQIFKNELPLYLHFSNKTRLSK